MLRNINNFFNILKKGRIKKTLKDNDMVPIGTRDTVNKSKYYDTAITFKDFKSQVGGGGGGGVTSVTGTAPLASTGGTTPDISIPRANAIIDGYCSASDFATFSGKQDALTLTTTGSGAATLVGSTLNIPTPTGGSGFWTANGSNIYNNNAGNVGVGSTTTQSKLTIQGNGSNGMTSAFQIQQSGVATPWLIASDAGTLSLTAVGTAQAKLSTAEFQLTTTPAAGKVLTSDASGNGTWETPTGMNTATVTLNSGSIKMGTSATILPAPAATKYYVIHSLVMKFKGGSVAFDQSVTYRIFLEKGVTDLSGTPGAPAQAIAIPTNTTDAFLYWGSGIQGVGQAVSANWDSIGSLPTVGDSDVEFDVTYELKDF